MIEIAIYNVLNISHIRLQVHSCVKRQGKWMEHLIMM